MSTETWIEYIKRKLAHTVLVFAMVLGVLWNMFIPVQATLDLQKVADNVESLSRMERSFYRKHPGIIRIEPHELLEYANANNAVLAAVFKGVRFDTQIASNIPFLGVYDDKGRIVFEDDSSTPGLDRNLLVSPNAKTLLVWPEGQVMKR